VLKRDFALAQRDKTDIALLLFDIDQLGPYNEIFDRAGGDSVVKRVARRSRFFPARHGHRRADGKAPASSCSCTERKPITCIQHATTVAHRVREQQIHIRGRRRNIVTVSGGVAIHTARPKTPPKPS
jgi:GGDEF domain-containing protein